MRFIEDNEIAEWLSDHGLQAAKVSTATADPQAGRVLFRTSYADGKRSGREGAAAEDCVRQLGTWSECLLLVTAWGIWPSSEDWPKYYAARGSIGERRSLDVAPGQLFSWAEQAELVRFLTVVMENGWDAEVIPASRDVPSGRRLFVSHDEWVEVREMSPVSAPGA